MLNIVVFHNLVSLKSSSVLIITIFKFYYGYSCIVHAVLSLILKQRSPTWLVERPEIKERIEALLPYTGELRAQLMYPN